MFLTTFGSTPRLRAVFALSCIVAICLAQNADAASGSFDEPATDSSVIASGVPDLNLETRAFTAPNFGSVLLMNTSNSQQTGTGGSVYATTAEAEASQEYMIFKFDDFASVDAGATVVGDASMTFAYWFTLQENTPGEADFGDFEVYEITAGDASWEGNPFADGSASGNEVTFNSLGGTFSKLTSVTEINPSVANGDHHDGLATLYPGKLVSNGHPHVGPSPFGAFQKVTGIPAATVQRLMDGTSVGLAFGGVGPLTNMNIHSHDTFLNDQNKNVRLLFDWTTDVVAVAGDYNGNGTVDAADYAIWLDSLGSTTDLAANGDDTGASLGVIDQADYDVWKANFGSVVATSSSNSIPEPTSLALFAGLMASAFFAGRRRNA